MDTRDDTISEVAATSAPRGGSLGTASERPDEPDIGAGFEVHNVLGAGFFEAVYANALTVELRRRGVAVDRNVAFEVVYRGVSVGRYVADFVVDRRVIVETKVAKAIDPVHRAQVSNYLRASGLEVGLVLNFGSSVQFKRVVASPRRVQVATKDESKLLRQDNGRPHTDEPRSQR